MKISILSHLLRSLLSIIFSPESSTFLSLLSHVSILKHDQVSHIKKQKNSSGFHTPLQLWAIMSMPPSQAVSNSFLSSVSSSWLPLPNQFKLSFFCFHHSLKDTMKSISRLPPVFSSSQQPLTTEISSLLEILSPCCLTRYHIL